MLHTIHIGVQKFIISKSMGSLDKYSATKDIFKFIGLINSCITNKETRRN